LKNSQVCDAIVVIEFASLSDREGDMSGRLEVKTGSSGGVPVEIKLPLGELLRPPPKSMGVQDFDNTMKRMHGFQRVETSFSTKLDLQGISLSIRKATALIPVGEKDTGEITSTTTSLRFIGMRPVSNEAVLALIDGPKAVGGIGKIVVCSDHAVAINSIQSLLKRTLNN
jgi:hypothetical protein